MNLLSARRYSTLRPVVVGSSCSLYNCHYDILYNVQTAPAHQSAFDVSFMVSPAPFLFMTSDLQCIYTSTTVEYSGIHNLALYTTPNTM